MSDDSRRIAWILCGPSGSGKTAVRNALLAAHPQAVVASSDDFVLAVAAARGLTYQQAYAAWRELGEMAVRDRIALAVDRFRDLIVDRTNLTAARRAPLIRALSETHRIIAVVPDFDPKSDEGRRLLDERRISRRDRGGEAMPARSIADQCAAWEPPEIAEGFDSVMGAVALFEQDAIPFPSALRDRMAELVGDLDVYVDADLDGDPDMN